MSCHIGCRGLELGRVLMSPARKFVRTPISRVWVAGRRDRFETLGFNCWAMVAVILARAQISKRNSGRPSIRTEGRSRAAPARHLLEVSSQGAPKPTVRSGRGLCQKQGR